MVGIIAGSLYGFFQQFQVNPIIYAAEVYEVAEAPDTFALEDATQHSAQEAWTPEDRVARISSTLIANILIGIGFALLLISAMSLHNLKSNKPKLNWQAGILWGLGLLAILFIAPSLLGLLPEIPGTLAQTLENRQIWWVFSALATASGLAVIYYAPRFVKLLGTAMQQPTSDSIPQNDLSTAVDSTTLSPSVIIQVLGATLLGIVMLYGVGFAPMDVAHNAAHDTRHAVAFPCH